MFSYITIGTNDLPRAKRFYDAVMGALGHGVVAQDDGEIGYGLAGSTHALFWVNTPFDERPASVGNGSMPAFAAQSRAQVDAFHRAGLAAGGRDDGAPGLRPYGAHFYACYLRDPDGNKISAVCERREDA